VKRRHSAPAAPAPQSVEAALARLDPRFRDSLLSMYRGEPQLGSDGERHPIYTTVSISPEQGMWLYDLCRSVKPKSTLEIGMAYGFSTLYILAAIDRNQGGAHTSVDPFQHAGWHGIGLANVASHVPADKLQSVFRLIEERSDRATVDLVRANASFDLIFIDGNHRFDDVLVDFYLCAPLCALGGRIIFDDMWLPSIQSVVAFIRANRTDFKELPSSVPNATLFQRVGDDTREWNSFHSFEVATEGGGEGTAISHKP
jgi:predicted O-methyltransferase YrrM